LLLSRFIQGLDVNFSYTSDSTISNVIITRTVNRAARSFLSAQGGGPLLTCFWLSPHANGHPACFQASARVLCLTFPSTYVYRIVGVAVHLLNLGSLDPLVTSIKLQLDPADGMLVSACMGATKCHEVMMGPCRRAVAAVVLMICY
jgi:hypothetical protein